MQDSIFIKPIINEKILELLKNKSILNYLIKKYHSPLNLIFKENIKDNINQLKKYLDTKNIKYFIFYSVKANSNFNILKEMIKNNLGFEVSSLSELLQVNKLKENKRILANGPKDLFFIKKILENNLIISVDSLEELKYLLNFDNLNLILRISNFPADNLVASYKSRFGISYQNFKEALKLIKENQKKIKSFGLGFHLDTNSDEEKKSALKNLIILSVELIKNGIPLNYIDIGGGYRFNYVEDKISYFKLIEKIKLSILNNNNYLWNNHNFGFLNINGKIVGSGSFFPFYSDIYGVNQLDKILNSYINEINTNALDFLRDFNIELIIEPGRFLLNHVGGTLMKIEWVIEEDNYSKILLSGNYKNVAYDHDILYDPILIKLNEKLISDTKGYFLFGNLCLENDIFFKRKIYFKAKPEKGDLIYFHNTAAYKMDISDSGFIHYKKPKKIVIKNIKNFINKYDLQKYS